ncbi:MAG: helix-turn-helix domain-containing protein [Prevotella sp.]|jgi:addiction module HigA family antidote|nr:helix-turn-helix domain-containing protein [Prevotella sp.]
MDSRIDIIKGIHPGKFIGRELKKQNSTRRVLAEETGIPYQTINAIIAGRRNLTTGQALKIDSLLNLEEGFLAILQTYYDIKQYREKELANLYTGCPRIRRILFWDTDFDKINWGKYKATVIKRIFERGNKEEMDEIKRFYNLSTSEIRQYQPKKIRSTKLIQRTNG